MNPEVSVIIPNYNHAAFLRQRLNSVLSQTFQDFEVIILDDASTDNSKEIIESYRGHQKIKHIIYNEFNSGTTFRQWEKGIQIAAGKYIWIAESDDYCSDYFLESAVNNLIKYNSGLHYSQSSLVDENNTILEPTLHWPESVTTINWKQPFFMNGREFIRKALQYKNVIPNASAVVFFKKEFDFTEFNIYKTAGDWYFWIKILLSSDISYSAQVLNSFRSHPNTTRTLSTHKKYILRHFEILSIKFKLFDKYHLTKKDELNHFLKKCADLCFLSDISFFRKFCKQFMMPKYFVFQFALRKFYFLRSAKNNSE